MGEVWRAEDTRLDRQVAIKVLPEEFATDPQRLARFEREAKLLAGLSHQNIASIHQVEEDAGVHFLVMELLEGEDLAEALSRGKLKIVTALEIALQVAAALEAAHQKSVVHRDLKPANVFLLSDGQVKILDFGLAKAIETVSPDSDQSASPTITAGMTALGSVLGTAAYMSPEQARGETVDRRADVWAFGCLLYEMLTGKRAFPGKTTTDVLAAIVGSDPDWDALPEATPRAVRRLLRRTLAKDSSVRSL